MTNILGDEKRQDVLALGRLGWTLRRIQKATGVRRETASAYLQAAGIAIQAPRHHYDPALNPLYRDVLAHYGAVALPCRVGDPDRKGKVESAPCRSIRRTARRRSA